MSQKREFLEKGVCLKRDKRTERTILLMDGEFTYSRYRLYACNTEEYPDSVKNCIEYYGSTSVYPIDIYLGIDKTPFKMSVDVALEVAFTGASSVSYETASKTLKKSRGWDIGAETVRKVTDYIGNIVLEEERRRTAEAIAHYKKEDARIAKRGRRPKDGFILYGEMDGAMFNTRPDPEDKTERDSSWKENKLGIVFRSDELHVSTDKEGNTSYHLGKREYVATTEGIDEFRKRFLAALIRNGLMEASAVVIIGDGADWITNFVNMYVPSAVHILDAYHAKENIMKFGKYLYNNDESLYAPWYKEVCKQLEEGKWREILARQEIAEYNPNKKGTKKTPGGVVNIYSYLYDRRDQLDYPRFKKKYHFVGSGAIESGNKGVLEERMKIAGQRWLVKNAERLVGLRAARKSEQWDSYVVPLIYKKYNQNCSKMQDSGQ